MDEFDRYRAAMNEKLIGSDHLGIKRFFALDTQAYEDGAAGQTYEGIDGVGLRQLCFVATIALLITSNSVSRLGLREPNSLMLSMLHSVVGGSITIPHLRRAIDRVRSTT